MKRPLYLCLLILFLSTNAFCEKNNAPIDSSYLDSNNNIVFNDLAFELKIKSILKKDTASFVNITEVEDIRELSISIPPRSKIIQVKSIDAIKYFKNLEIFVAGFNSIKSLKPLSNLAKLTCISMQNNLVEDIGPLANLVNLHELELYMNRVKNISALKDLKKLDTIGFFGNDIEDISVLRELPELNDLNFGNNRITDISCLERQKKITSLWLYGNRIKNPEVIGQLRKNLKSLSIAKCGLTNIKFLRKCTKLETLILFSNNIKDLSPIKNLKHLTSFLAGNNKIENIDILVSLVDKGGLTEKGVGFPFKLDLANNKIDYSLPHNIEIRTYLSSKIPKCNF